MRVDDRAIRNIIDEWLAATAVGSLPKLLSLLADDVGFLIPGQPPMRKDAFVSRFQQAFEQSRSKGKAVVQEIHVEGDMAYCWNYLVVTMIPRVGGEPARREGHILTVPRRPAGGDRVIARDVSLVM